MKQIITWSCEEIDGYGSLYVSTSVPNGTDEDVNCGYEAIAEAFQCSYAEFGKRLSDAIALMEEDNDKQPDHFKHDTMYIYCANYGENKWSLIVTVIPVTRVQIFQNPIVKRK